MLQVLKKKLNEQKGFTLIELLAVIVILGILAAVAVPSVLGIINNSKNDAHAANAQQMISAAKMLIASDSNYQKGYDWVTLSGLENMNYLDPVDSPTAPYVKGQTDTLTADDDTVSYVKINDGKIVKINLITTDSPAKYIRVVPASGQTAVSPKDIDRGDVH